MMKTEFDRISDEFSDLVSEKEMIEINFRTIDEFGDPCWRPGWEKKRYGVRYRDIVQRLEILNTAHRALIRA